MIYTKQILSERKEEINLYVKHLQSVENNVSSTLFKVLKANTILMLYNLIESVVANGIEGVRKAIYQDEAIEFDNLSPENFVKLCQNVSNDIIKLSFKKENIATGNIDLNEIKNLSQIYGFSISGSDYNETKHGKTITDIKGKRNDLAHGTYSFSEIGKDYSLEDIQKLSIQTVNFLEFLVQNIENYLKVKAYKLVN